MKKGFTLAELLGVLVVLALISIIVIPSVSKTLKDYKTKTCVIQMQNIIEAAKSWASENIEQLPTENGNYRDVSLNDLIKYNYISEDTVNPKTNKPFDDDLVVRIEKYQKKYNYKLYKIGNPLDTLDDIFVVDTDYCE